MNCMNMLKHYQKHNGVCMSLEIIYYFKIKKRKYRRKKNLFKTNLKQKLNMNHKTKLKNHNTSKIKKHYKNYSLQSGY